MDDGSPITLDFSYQFEDSPHDIDSGTSEAITGYSISNAIPDGLNGQNYNSLTASQRSKHRQDASMASVDSTTEQGGLPIAPRSSTQQTGRGRAASMADSQKDADGGDAPAWSELKTKAGKERKRLPLACIACRRKKIKCSGEKPACKHCLKARIPCVYKVTTRKAAPRTDYMAMLDKRLKRMEDRVIKIIPKEDLPDTTQRSSVRPPLPGTTSKPDKPDSGNKRTVEEAFTNELQDWSKGRTGSTALDSAARTRPPRETENKLMVEGLESLPQTHIQEHLAEVFFDCVYGQSYLLLHKPSFMRKLKAGSVPPVLMLAVCAVSARFSTHPQVSTEPAFLRGEQWASAARIILEKRHFEPNITILTCMIILGLHYFGTCEGGLSWSFGGQAMRMGYALQLHKELDQDPLGLAQAERAEASGKPVPNTPQLTFTDREIRRRTMWACFLMDTFNSSGTERPSFLNEDYMFIQLPIKESNFQMEIPGHTEDLEGHVPLSPTRSSLEDIEAEARGNMGVSAYIIRAVVVWKRIVKYMNLGGKDKDAHPLWDPLSTFGSLQRQIAQLKQSLPPSLEYTKENLQAHITERLANQFIFMHIIMAQNSLFLHRFAIPTAPNTHRLYPANTPKSFLATAATTVLDAANQISKLLADSTGHTLVVPFAGYCAYASATVHVWGIFSKNTMLENSSRENLRHNYKYLNRMKRYWGMFHYMAESIKDTYRAFADAAARVEKKQQAKLLRTESGRVETLDSGAVSAEQSSRAGSPSAGNDLGDGQGQSKTDAKVKVFQYGDWFNKYPHGVSEQEWEQSHLPHRGEALKGTEAVMSQRAELQSVEEFFASLSPPSKAEEGPNKKKMARKRGKSIVEEKRKDGSTTEGAKGQANSSRKLSQSTTDSVQRQKMPTSNSLYPLSDAEFPQFDPWKSELDVPMSGMSAGLQSGHGNSAFDLTSPTNQDTNYNNNNNQFMPGVTSNPQQRPSVSAAGQSPFEYTSPSGSSNTGTINPSTGMNFNFNYTSAVPQLDRQMVFGGYANIDPSSTGQTNALNNINNLDFWSNPFDSSIDMDGMTGFNDPSFGLNTGTTNPHRSSSTDESAHPQHHPSLRHLHSTTQQQQHPANHNPHNQGHHPRTPHHGFSNSQGQNMSSTAWFMPFNIDPPNATNFQAGSTPGGLEDFAGFDSMMDMHGGPGGFGFSPAGTVPGEEG